MSLTAVNGVRRVSFVVAATATLAGAAPRDLPAQAAAHHGKSGARSATTTEQFIARARTGTARYRSQDAAITDGYKPVGVEFPAMGQHWVHLGRVLEDSLIPERPSVLIYATIGGEPRLAGVAYTDLLDEGDAPPSFLAPGGWHEHNGSVADESLPFAHESARRPSAAGSAAESEMRLAVLHAWLWTTNPASVFVTDNWALPSLRLGVPVAASVPRDALQALALADDEDGYLLLTLRTALGLTTAEEAAASNVLSAAKSRAEHEQAAARKARRLTPETTARLVSLWASTWSELERALPRRVAPLRALRRQLG